MPSSKSGLGAETRRARSVSLAALAALASATSVASPAAAEQSQPQGFALERLSPSAPGGGWIVMDALDMRGALGGAMAISTGYAHDPLRISSSDGSQHLALVSDQAFTDFGFAATYRRWRVYMNLDMPLAISGQSGSVGRYDFKAPSLALGSSPDALSDARVGADARFYGAPRGPLRLGGSAQIFAPNGSRGDYDTDGTFRGMFRALFAGDVGRLAYAGHLGVHVRSREHSATPLASSGSEFLFGLAAGPRFMLPDHVASLVLGPEIFGETALRSLFGETTTGLEALGSARLEGDADNGPQLRVKLGAGGGLHHHFGAPEWRVVFGVEVFDHRSNPGVSRPVGGGT